MERIVLKIDAYAPELTARWKEYCELTMEMGGRPMDESNIGYRFERWPALVPSRVATDWLNAVAKLGCVVGILSRKTLRAR